MLVRHYYFTDHNSPDPMFDKLGWAQSFDLLETADGLIYAIIVNE